MTGAWDVYGQLQMDMHSSCDAGKSLPLATV
jgi:hypothetical protein